MHAASTCSASGARGAAAALPIKAASSKSGREARFAILRLQLVEEANTGFCGACGRRRCLASAGPRFYCNSDRGGMTCAAAILI